MEIWLRAWLPATIIKRAFACNASALGLAASSVLFNSDALPPDVPNAHFGPSVQYADTTLEMPSRDVAFHADDTISVLDAQSVVLPVDCHGDMTSVLFNPNALPPDVPVAHLGPIVHCADTTLEMPSRDFAFHADGTISVLALDAMPSLVDAASDLKVPDLHRPIEKTPTGSAGSAKGQADSRLASFLQCREKKAVKKKKTANNKAWLNFVSRSGTTLVSALARFKPNLKLLVHSLLMHALTDHHARSHPLHLQAHSLSCTGRWLQLKYLRWIYHNPSVLIVSAMHLSSRRR